MKENMWEIFMSYAGSGADHFCSHAIARPQHVATPNCKGGWEM